MDEPLVLVTPGGGEDGYSLVIATLLSPGRDAAGAASAHARGLRAGDERGTQRATVHGRPAALPNVSLQDFCDDMMSMMAAADVVVAMGGYNTVCELLTLRKRAVLVPRIKPGRSSASAPSACRPWAWCACCIPASADAGRLDGRRAGRAAALAQRQPVAACAGRWTAGASCSAALARQLIGPLSRQSPAARARQRRPPVATPMAHTRRPDASPPSRQPLPSPAGTAGEDLPQAVRDLHPRRGSRAGAPRRAAAPVRAGAGHRRVSHPAVARGALAAGARCRRCPAPCRPAGRHLRLARPRPALRRRALAWPLPAAAGLADFARAGWLAGQMRADGVAHLHTHFISRRPTWPS
jgi:hypothetical protein